MTTLPALQFGSATAARFSGSASPALHFGQSDAADTADMQTSGVKVGDTTYKNPVDMTKKLRLFRGSLGGALSRGFGGYFSLKGLIELPIDIACMVFLIPPPFFLKHFTEGLFGAQGLIFEGASNNMFTKAWRSLFGDNPNVALTTDKDGNEKAIHRTVLGALTTHVGNLFRRVTGKDPVAEAFDIARFNNLKAKQATSTT